MVYYFKSSGSSGSIDPPVVIYMGKNKEENEDLIKWGLDNDVWFHVDNLSSAHVYLRLPKDTAWTEIPEELLEDCAQLTKANSIQGNKRDDVKVIYTPWSNLHKSGAMAVGQVGFEKSKEVRKVHISTRINAILNRLNKTKEERFPNLQHERMEYDKEQAHQIKSQQRQERVKKEEFAKQRQKEQFELEHGLIEVDEELEKSLEQFDDFDDDDFM